MRGLGAALRAFWDGRGSMGLRVVLTLLTAPLAWVFAFGVGIRNRRYARRIAGPVPIPVISVGNLSVGGTGKTPIGAWVVALLAGEWFNPCLVARGYGQDELALHRRWNPGAGLEADPDRTAAVARAAASGHDVAVLDDGFQHRALRRDLDLVLIAAEEGIPGHLLPRGPFREPASALSRANGVIITRKSASVAQAEGLEARIRSQFPHLEVARVRFQPGGWQSLEGAAASAPRPPLVAACSIARPDTFHFLVESLTGSEAPMVVFPDHHEFSSDDLAELAARTGEGTLIVTEKDAVKLMDRLPPEVDARVLPLAVMFEAGEAEITGLVLGAVGGSDRVAS